MPACRVAGTATNISGSSEADQLLHGELFIVGYTGVAKRTEHDSWKVICLGARWRHAVLPTVISIISICHVGVGEVGL